jgi:hypothetical protein
MYTDALNSSSGKYGGSPTNVVFVTDSTAITIQADDSGKVHVVPDLTADSTITLPSPKEGMYYEFWYGGTAADAHDWTIDTGSDTNYFIGGLVQHDTDAGGDDTAVVDSDNNSNSKLGVLTPIAGTTIKCCSDGVVWYLNGTVVSATDTGITFNDQ